MTLANVRLGYWLRNPRHGVEKTEKLDGPGPSCLFREMFAIQMDENAMQNGDGCSSSSSL
jgi:hypothetical protein